MLRVDNGRIHVSGWEAWASRYRQMASCEQIRRLYNDAADQAAGGGHFEIVKFLLENRSEGCTTKAANEAAGNGHLDIVKYILASKRGHYFALAPNKPSATGVARWPRNNGTKEWSSEAIDEAAKRGHV